MEPLKSKKALVIVDLQNDFCPGGTIPVKDGNQIIRPINDLIAAFEDEDMPVVFTRDWHPRDHSSFQVRGGPWPPHCVQGTCGAELHPDLMVPHKSIIIIKGSERDRDAYSGFQGTDLVNLLRELGVKQLFVAGLATEYCVKETTLDALRNGFETSVIGDCISGVKPATSSKAVRLMQERGARVTSSSEILEAMSRRVAVSSSS